MQWKPLDRNADERAVSPVVGVALLIAMTVILAAVIGVVVLGIGVGPAEAPQATLSFEDDGGDIYVVHNGGDALDSDEITVETDATNQNFNDDMTAGDRQQVASDAVDGDDVVIIWEDPGSDSTTTIADFTV